MRRIHVDKLKEGMIISKPIYSSNGIILLSEGVQLSDRYIEKIIGTGLQHIYIKDELSSGINDDEIIKEETKIATKKVLQDSLLKIKSGCFASSDGIIKQVEGMIREIVANPRVMVSVQEIRNRSDYSLMHAINVSVISCLLGKKMKYNETQLKHLAIGALFHDLGKVNIKMDCTRYREDYIEQELNLYKQHTDEGFEMIQLIPDASLLSANVARMHHENFDGTGFPLGLKGDAIHEFARIVAVANEYDNLIYNLPFGTSLKHYEIIEVIIAKSFTSFDPKVVRIFANSISPYPLGSGVILSNNQIGIVSKINQNFPTRPFIRMVDPDSLKLIEEIDLSTNPSILILDEKDIDK